MLWPTFQVLEFTNPVIYIFFCGNHLDMTWCTWFLSFQLNDHGRRLGKKRQQFPKYSHQHLKVVELHGFLGRQFDVELAQYLFQNATMLEKLIIEPSRYVRKKVLRNCVKMLEAKVPHSVKLIVGSLYTD